MTAEHNIDSSQEDLLNVFRKAGIITVSVGVGRAYEDYLPSKLLEIAGNESRVFEARNFSNLNAITDGLLGVIEDSASIALEGL